MIPDRRHSFYPAPAFFSTATRCAGYTPQSLWCLNNVVRTRDFFEIRSMVDKVSTSEEGRCMVKRAGGGSRVCHTSIIMVGQHARAANPSYLPPKPCSPRNAPTQNPAPLVFRLPQLYNAFDAGGVHLRKRKLFHPIQSPYAYSTTAGTPASITLNFEHSQHETTPSPPLTRSLQIFAPAVYSDLPRKMSLI
jgi:hypothetical protein